MNPLGTLVMTLGVVVASSAVAQAATAGAEEKSQQPQNGGANVMDSMQFCYIDGKAYSEGWKVDNKICDRSSGDAFNAKDSPLRWRGVTAIDY